MTNRESDADPWKEHTQIDREELLEHLFKCEEWEKSRLKITTYCIEPSHNVFETGPFIEYVSNEYPKFVFSKDEIQEMFEEGTWPFKEAQKRSDFPKDPRNDGKLGELILFLFVDAVLEIPMVSHKISWTQEPVQEVKGSDGLFYGEYDGKESLALGESKIQKRRSDALRNSLDSINRFHDSEGSTKTDHELSVAASNLSSNLSDSKIRRLMNLFTGQGSPYQKIHPIFAAYDEEWMLDLQAEAENEEHLRDLVCSEIENSGVYEYLTGKLEENKYESLKKYHLMFFLLPLEDVDKFREELQQAIYPHSSI
ncbi:DUF1837 domain-containing protein [Halorubrum ezzemoulense]|uniref:HamA C-terminal domain-containing protein n=1 Tax=Halorubrum ezzemoulense TaxID=337243 RepID=UPI00232DC39D|nr:DUF1837 domain-containing protein [Halorubrum ezzemoulense]MDB2261375.1 DUF1837 domain-containing protein [Halorubrum ezzemoulense]MDB2268136.1 DUF1837 domain-containing protein [Halorubrum ezzemoulense]